MGYYRITVLNEDFTLQSSKPYYNLELFTLQVTDDLAVSSYEVASVLEIADSSGVYVLIIDPGTPALQAAAETIVLTTADTHDAALKTTKELIAAQVAIAQVAARDNLYNYRDKTPVAMYAIVIAQRLRDLQGDADEIESQAQAVTYFTSKMIEHATLIDTGNTSDAGTLLRHAFQAVFLTFVETSEWKANGSDD